MKKTIFKYGLYGSGLMILLFSISFFFEDNMSFETAEIFGYLSIVLALTSIFFGIKQYRNSINNGTLTFFKGLKIGLLITVFPAITFGSINIVYTEFINPEFSELYYKEAIEKQRVELSDNDFRKKRIELLAQQEAFGNPIFKFLLMSFTVFILGFIIAVFSSFILKRKV